MQLEGNPLSPRRAAGVLLAILMTSAAAAAQGDLRIVTYNIDADTGGTVGIDRQAPMAGRGWSPFCRQLAQSTSTALPNPSTFSPWRN